MSTFRDGIGAQQAELRRRLDAGMPRAGWKICINDLRMQHRLGIDASFAGFLDGSRALRSGDTWKVEEGSLPGVEPEFALRFRAAVAPGDEAAAVRLAIAGAAPALEVVDWKDAKLDLASIAASSSFHAGFVVGELRGLDRLPSLAEGWPVLRRGEDVLAAPDPSLVPEDLPALVARIANELAARGEGIEAGDWLICGACTAPARVEAGDEIHADFGSLGAVSVRFTA